jgi:hypothetical protein
MPKIPTYERRYLPPGQSGNVQTDVGSAGIVGNAIQKAGNTGLAIAEEYSDVIARNQEKIKKQDADNTILTIGAAVDKDHYDFMASELGKEGTDAYDALDRVKKYSEDAVKKHTDGIEDPYISQKIKEHVNSRTSSAMSTLAHHQANQRTIVRDKAISLTLETTVKDSYAGIDPLPTHIERFTRAVMAQVANGSRSESNAEELLMKGRSAIAEAYLDGIVNRSPAAAMEMIKSGVFGQFMVKAKIDEFDKKANTIAEAQKKDAEAEIKEKERLAKEKLKESRDATGNDFVSRYVAGTLKDSDILKSNLEPTGENSKEHWIEKNRVRRERAKAAAEKGDGKIKTDKMLESSLYARIVKDPESVTETEILDHMDSKLTKDDAKQLIDERAKRIKGEVDPARAAAESALMENFKRDRKAGIFGEGQDGDKEYVRQVEAARRWIKAHPKEEISDYYEKIMEPQKIGAIMEILDFVPFVNPQRINPAAAREQMEKSGEIPKGKEAKKIVGYKDGKPVYDLRNGKWQVGD